MTKISRTTDMTQGSEMRHIIMFSLPLLAGNLLQQTYNIVDTMVVGRYLGDDALAAVGATGSITYLFYTLCIGLSVGAGIIVAQYFGAGKKKALRSAVFNSALVTAIFGVVISLLSVPAAKPILELLKVPDKLIGDSAAYMQIACGGTIAVAAYNWINAIMRALGDSKTPLIFLGAASLLNALLDLLFCGGIQIRHSRCGMGYSAYAGTFCHFLYCVLFCSEWRDKAHRRRSARRQGHDEPLCENRRAYRHTKRTYLGINGGSSACDKRLWRNGHGGIHSFNAYRAVRSTAVFFT